MDMTSEVTASLHPKCQYCHQDVAEVQIVESGVQVTPAEGTLIATHDNGLWSHAVCWSFINEPERIARVIRESR